MAVTTPVWPSNMKRQTSAATTVGIAHGRSAASRTAPRPRVAVCMMSASPRPRPSSTGTVTAANATVWTNAARNRGSPAASMKLSRPMNGRPSHGSRRSWRCSASQAVAAIGTSEPARMKASAGATRIGASQRSSARAFARPGPSGVEGRGSRPRLRQPGPNAREGHASRRRRGEAPPPVSACPLSARCSSTCRISDSSLYTGVTGRGTAASSALADLLERDRQRVGERGVVVQRPPRWKLRGHARPLEHLLGRGEKPCELPRRGRDGRCSG